MEEKNKSVNYVSWEEMKKERKKMQETEKYLLKERYFLNDNLEKGTDYVFATIRQYDCDSDYRGPYLDLQLNDGGESFNLFYNLGDEKSLDSALNELEKISGTINKMLKVIKELKRSD